MYVACTAFWRTTALLVSTLDPTCTLPILIDVLYHGKLAPQVQPRTKHNMLAFVMLQSQRHPISHFASYRARAKFGGSLDMDVW
jgi:hypothetical protein